MIKKNAYLRGLILLLSGSVISQVINFLFTPVISRLFTPEQMGIYTLILSVVNMFGSIVCARYDMVIISSKSEDEVYNLILLSTIIGIFSSLFATFGFYLYVYMNIELRAIIGVWSLIVFPILVLYSFINILNAHNNRHGNYGLISEANVIRVIVLGVFQTISGVIGIGYVGLIFSYLLSNIISVKRLSKNLLKSIDKISLVKKNDLIRTLKKYKNQPLFSTPAIFFNSASYSLLPFLINNMFNSREVGLYSISFRLLGVPLALISTNFSKVFFQKASEYYNINQDFRKLYIRTAIFLTAIALPMVIILFFWSEEIVTIVFGTDWLNASLYIRILAPMFGIRMIVSALSVSLIITGKQKYDMLLQSLFLISTIFTYFVSSILNLEIDKFILIISILFSFNYLVYGYIGYYYSKHKK